MKDSNYTRIARYLEGEATEQEKKQLQEWRKAKPDHEKQFQEVQLLWDKGQLAKVYEKDIEVDVKGALSKVKKQFPKPAKVVNLRHRFLRLAAAASVLLAVGTFWFFNGKVDMLEVATLANEQKEITLPDNSKVWLNENSTLRYPEKFASKNRTVSMSGDVIFEVTPNKTKPFQVKTAELAVEVLGTKFNVQSIEKEDPIVHVLHGKVQVQKVKDTSRTIILEKGMSAKLNKANQELQSNKAFATNELFWHNNTLTFNESELKKVFKDIENAYGVKLNTENESLLNCPFNGQFENKTATDILETLQLIYRFKIKETKTNHYQITEGTCN